MTGRSRRGRCTRRGSTAVAAGALIGLGLTACGGDSLSIRAGSVSACYRAIPPAVAAVHDTGARLVGVQRLTPAEEATTDADARRPADGTVCAVALAGPFDAGQVNGSSLGGRYAVVLVTSDGQNVVGIFVTDQLPNDLRGRTF